jgi:hypothetical protein
MSHYESDEGNYEDEEKEMGHYALPKGFAEHRYPKGLSCRMTEKNMMDQKNPSYGCQVIFKPSKYSEAQGRRQCKDCSYTSPAQHGLG